MSLKYEYKQYDVINIEDINNQHFLDELSELVTIRNGNYYLDKYCGSIALDHCEITIKPAYNADLYHMVNYLKMNNPEDLDSECKPLFETIYDMWMLFECYARSVLNEIVNSNGYLCCLDSKNPFDRNVQSYIQPTTNKEDKLLRPDIIIKKESEYIIFDAKFKDGFKKYNIREDRLQILAYALKWNCNKVGHIFPSIDGNLRIEETEISRKSGDIGKYIQIFIPTQTNNWDKDKILNYI